MSAAGRALGVERTSMTGQFGFFGKIPARGDFIRVGLPPDFVTAWDRWIQLGMLEGRRSLSDLWALCWDQAPIWRFHLPPGACGAKAALGLFMPSVDKVGRNFPLTFVWLTPGFLGFDDGDRWLDIAEAAGLAALSQNAEPEALATRLSSEPMAGSARSRIETGSDCVWWTTGAAREAKMRFVTKALPEPDLFSWMLSAQLRGDAASPPTVT